VGQVTGLPPDASSFPPARPALAKTLDAFIERMNSVAQGSVRSFEEHMLGLRTRVLGKLEHDITAVLDHSCTTVRVQKIGGSNNPISVVHDSMH
jgi:hypothetical protein